MNHSPYRTTPYRTTPARRRAGALRALLAALLAAAVAALVAAPASATAYRYWSYWQGASGAWVMAQAGPGDYDLVDQDVQGWRFAISTPEVSAQPDNSPDFATLCPELAAGSAPDGQLRVAVVIDAGFVADAPTGQTPPADEVRCVTVPAGSTGSQALAAAAKVTETGGMVCALNGFPEGECSAEVSDADASAAAAAAASESPNPAVVTAASASAEPVAASPEVSAVPVADSPAADDSNSTGFLIGAVILVAVLAAAVLVPRRRRRQRDASTQ